jgi:hypothetical protein
MKPFENLFMDDLERLIVKAENYSISLNLEVPCVIWRMKGVPRNSETYRNSVKAMMTTYSTYKPALPKLETIIDGSEVGGIRPADLIWACEWWAEKVKPFGSTLFAMVKPKTTFGKLALDTYLSVPKVSWVEIRAFDTLNDAKVWIRNYGYRNLTNYN